VLVSPDGRRVAVDWEFTYDLRDAHGDFVDVRDDGGRRFVDRLPNLLVGDDMLVANGAAYAFSDDGLVRALPGCGEGASVLVARVGADACLSVQYFHGYRRGDPDGISIESERLRPPPWRDNVGVQLVRFPWRMPVSAAMAPDGNAVFAWMSTRRGPAAWGITRVTPDPSHLRVAGTWTVALPYEVGGLSLVPPYIAVLGAPAMRGHTLHALDAAGREAWSAEVPFQIMQPPIDCAGRICLAGFGLASVEQGRVVWSRYVGEVVYATAFDDGSLAVGWGHDLRMLSRDGAERQRLSVADDERITTPPAIAGDGSIWVATAEAVYVARPTWVR
jgi:hypothetical protein